MEDGYRTVSPELSPGPPAEVLAGGDLGVLWDPYMDHAEIEMEPDGAGDDHFPVQPSSSNFGWAQFSTPGLLGSRLAHGAVSGVLPKGMESFFKQVKHLASSDALPRRQGLFPLPVDFPSAASEVNESSGAAQVTAWTNLICLALNKLAGWTKPVPSQRKGVQSSRAVLGIRSRVQRFLNLFSGKAEDPEVIWEDLKRKRISYDGEEFSDPVAVTCEQIYKSLPPEGHGGSVDLVPLLVGRARFLLENPQANLLDESLKEPGPNTAKVHIAAGEELQVWSLLKERRVIDWLPLDKVHRDSKGPYLSGLFGVEKPNRFTASGLPLLRVIINLQPINRALKIIKGDISELPVATCWTQLCLSESETIHVSQADMSSAFYLFKLPEKWKPFLCFNSRHDGEALGLTPGVTYVPSCCVLPMGWSSSVGLMQMASRELIVRNSRLNAAELRRQVVAPHWFVDIVQRAGGKQFWQVYLDNYMAAEVGPVESSREKSMALHREAVGIWNEEGVLCAEDKHVHASQEAIELGVALNGKESLVGGGPVRFHHLLVVTLLLLGEKCPKVKCVQIVLGRWIFVLQYRRPAMATLSRCWAYTRKGQDRRRWWPIVKDELCTLLCLTPLLQFDLRMAFSELATASDASHYGGAVAVSQDLTRAGRSLLGRAANPMMEPIAAQLLVISAFNGIGGAFRGYDLSGVRPSGLISIEWDKGARRVTRKAWPQVLEIKDINDITFDMVQEWFNLFPRVTHVHLIGGFPCVHLSAVRAGRQNLAGEGSKLFWALLQLIRWVEQVFQPTAQVDFVVENVLSMDASAREEISHHLQVEPLALCPSDVLPYNRPRLAWVSAEVHGGSGVALEQQPGYTRVRMSAAGVADSAWIEPGWHRVTPEVPLPTFMKAIKRQRPPPQPVGISRCEPAAIDRWESDAYKFPPYQYRRQYLLKNA